MTNRIPRAAWRTLLVAVLVAGLGVMAGCPSDDGNGKKPTNGGDTPTNGSATSNGGDTPTNGSATTEMVEKKIELPNPMFVGTPPITENLQVNVDTKNPESKRAPLEAPADVKVISRGKPVTSSDDLPMIGDLPLVTDGDKEATEGSYVELAPEKQWVQIDLGDKYEIWGIVIWHYHANARVYRDTIVQLADDPDFTTGVQTVFNNDNDNSYGLGVGNDFEYFDEHVGKLIRVDGKTARYVRLHSNGNTANDQNHYIEVEIWGRPAK